MRILLTAAATVVASVGVVAGAHADVTDASFWINEFHYDNTGTDSGEFVEVVVPFGTANLSDYAIVLYNGATGASYDTDPLNTFTQGATVGDFTIYSFTYPSNGIQNGSPDGIAFVNTATATVFQFISYEGSFAATNGPATGLTSTDILVSQNGTEPAGTSSLHLTGTGNSYMDFTWAATTADASVGQINVGQSFTAVPEPGAAGLLGLAGMLALRRRRL